MERLYTDGVKTVCVGDLTYVLSTYWCTEVNAKTHQFWAFRAFIDRLSNANCMRSPIGCARLQRCSS